MLNSFRWITACHTTWTCQFP